MLPDKDMMVQIQEIKNITSKLKNLGYPLSEEYQAIAILIALPHEWSTLWTIILNKSGLLMLQETINSIVEHETMLQQQHDSAMVAHHCPWFQTPAPQSNQPTSSKMFCTNCKQDGHTIKWCWSAGGRAEGKGPRYQKSKQDLKGKQKEVLVNITSSHQSESPPLAILIILTI